LAALNAAHAPGLRVSKVVNVSDIDSERLLLQIEQGEKRQDLPKAAATAA
jgi:hypothetical protein